MNLLRLKLDGFHCALLVAIVLLAVYGFGSGEFREGMKEKECAAFVSSSECGQHHWCEWGLDACVKKKEVVDIQDSACSYKPKENNCGCSEKHNKWGWGKCKVDADCAGERQCREINKKTGIGICDGPSGCDGGYGAGAVWSTD